MKGKHQKKIDLIYFQSLAYTIEGYISKGIRKLVLTSSGPREGKSTITANLGRALARSGKRQVVLVDTDWIKPTLHKIFGMENTRGLGEALQEADPIERVRPSLNQLGMDHWVQGLLARAGAYPPLLSGRYKDCEKLFSYLKDTRIENLKLLTSGTLPYELQDPAIAEQFRALLDGLAQKFDIILIDSPPVALASPAVALAALADGVLMVVKSDGLDVEIIQQAKDELVNARANLLGVILNQVDLKESKYLSYYYSAYRR